MIIVNLKGGLGNQMFQYALGRKLSLKHNDVLKLDISGLDRANRVGNLYRPYALDQFAITASIAHESEIQALKYPYGIFSKLIRAFRFRILKERHLGFEPRVLTQTENIYLDGYWQSPKYFADIRGALVNEFTLRQPLSSRATALRDMMQAGPSVSVHVRRGDFATNPADIRYKLLNSLKYYEHALTHVRKIIPTFLCFVFSDDPEWVKKNLALPNNSVYVSDFHLNDAEELVLMSKCSHNIITNSTFSWWGAWLNQNPKKIVTAPTPWTGNPHERRILEGIVPDTWVKIDVKLGK